MTKTRSIRCATRDDSGMSLVELMVAMTLFVVVMTIGFVVTSTVVRVTYSTQRSGFLTGPAQNGMETLQGFFSGAVPNQTISTPSGAELYANQCSATALTSTATDVWLCAVRSGSNTAYSYEIHFPSSTCTPNGICTLQIDQQGSAQPVAQIDNVCAHCANATNTSFGFTPTPADLSVIPLVAITLTIAAPTTNGNANPSTTTTVVRQVMLSNSLGGLL